MAIGPQNGFLASQRNNQTFHKRVRLTSFQPHVNPPLGLSNKPGLRFPASVSFRLFFYFSFNPLGKRCAHPHNRNLYPSILRRFVSTPKIGIVHPVDHIPAPKTKYSQRQCVQPIKSGRSHRCYASDRTITRVAMMCLFSEEALQKRAVNG